MADALKAAFNEEFMVGVRSDARANFFVSIPPATGEVFRRFFFLNSLVEKAKKTQKSLWFNKF